MTEPSDEVRAAIDQGDLTAVKELIQAEPDLLRQPLPPIDTSNRDAPDFNEKSKQRSQILRYRPVTYAAVKAETEILSFLLAEGGDPMEYSNFPLCRAALYSRCIPAMEMLIDHGADVNRVGNDYGPPLIFAVEGSNLDCMKLLLEHGANISGSGESLTQTVTWDALKHATSFNRGTPGMIALLLEFGADVHSTVPDPSTPDATALHGAAEKGDIKGVKLLLEYGADPQKKDGQGQLPIDVTKNKKVRDLLEKT